MGLRLSRPSLGKYFSEGARLLWLQALAGGLSQKEIAERIGLASNDGQVNSWLYGRRRPGLKPALDIELALGIPARAWTEPPSEAFAIPTREARTGTDG